MSKYNILRHVLFFIILAWQIMLIIIFSRGVSPSVALIAIIGEAVNIIILSFNLLEVNHDH